jgi:hypothetical protein
MYNKGGRGTRFFELATILLAHWLLERFQIVVYGIYNTSNRTRIYIFPQAYPRFSGSRSDTWDLPCADIMQDLIDPFITARTIRGPAAVVICLTAGTVYRIYCTQTDKMWLGNRDLPFL